MSAVDEKRAQALRDIANKIRIHSIVATCASKSGHPTSSCSMAEILSVLHFNEMKYLVKDPRDPRNDRLVLSKGHGCPALYGAWVEAGMISEADLKSLRKINSDIEGHPTPRLKAIDVATGSLGMGLSFAAGMAYVGKHYDGDSYRVYCVLGDGECAEGSVWEAFHFAAMYKLNNLCAIIDVNRLGQSDPTSLQHDMATYKARVESFGWHGIVVDGHDVVALSQALSEATATQTKPTCLIAKTYKGRGIPDIEDQMNWHGKPLPADKAETAIAAIKSCIVNPGPHGLCPPSPDDRKVPAHTADLPRLAYAPNYKLGDKVATRAAYGTALVNLGTACSRVISLDGDVKNSTMAQTFQKQFPDRFIECFIAESNMIGVAIGAGTRDRTIPFVSTFAAFLARGYDFIRMGGVCFSNVNFCGSHCGVSIGADGPSQMALEDLAMFRAIPGCVVFYPSDAVSMERAVELAAGHGGMTFIRSTRAATPVIYNPDEKFSIGGAKVVRHSENDSCTVVAAAVTLVEAINAANSLANRNIGIRVIDPFTIKPIDTATLVDSARMTGGRVLVVEDHYAEGGIGDAVCAALSDKKDLVVHKLAVNEVPRSGEPAELMKLYGIDAAAIEQAVEKIVKA